MLILIMLVIGVFSPVLATVTYPHNATSCEQCHVTPSRFGSNPLTVKRVGVRSIDTFIPGPEGGIEHKHGASHHSEKLLGGDRVALNVLGDGYVEAIPDEDLIRNSSTERLSGTAIAGVLTWTPVL